MATVLIVDDEPDILLFVRVNLELAGHEVRTRPTVARPSRRSATSTPTSSSST